MNNSFEEGMLIAVNDCIYEYGGIENGDYCKGLKLHKVYEIDIGEDGILIATYISCYLTNEELNDGIDKITLTQKQWVGVIEHFLMQENSLNEDDIPAVAEDIVFRCFAYGIPKFHELQNFITDYINR